MRNWFTNGAIVLMILMFGLSAQAQFTPQKIKSSLDKLNNESEMDVAVSLIRNELPDYYPAEITASLKASYPTLPEDRTIRVLPYVREHLINQGKDFDRVKLVAGNLLKYMSLDQRVRVVYFDSEVPVTAFTYPFALVVSSAAANLLSDEELEAVLAHEICHLIVYENFKAAVESNNLKELRAIELFCDGGAISIIQAKGKDPKKLLSGLEKMQEMLVRVNNDTEDGLKHPTIRQRKQFYKELNEKFNVALSKAIK